MHELGLIIDVVEKVDRIAEEQNLKKIDKVVLQVGEAFSVVPQMMKAVYRRSIPGTRLEGSALEIEIIEASAEASLIPSPATHSAPVVRRANIPCSPGKSS